MPSRAPKKQELIARRRELVLQIVKRHKRCTLKVINHDLYAMKDPCLERVGEGAILYDIRCLLKDKRLKRTPIVDIKIQLGKIGHHKIFVYSLGEATCRK